MAIPNDPILEEETISPVLPSDAVVAKDQDINGNEILNDEDDYVQVAGLGKGISKIVKPVSDFFDSGADVIVAPAVKKAKEKANLEEQNIIDQSIDENPLVVTANGELRIRSANPDEMEMLSGYANTPQPMKSSEQGGKKKKWKVEDAKGEKIIIPNLDNVTSLDGDDASLQKFIAQTFLAYRDAKLDGKKILEKGNRGFKQIIQDANKIGSVDIFLDLMNRKKGDRVFNDAEVLASSKTVLSLQIHAKNLLKKAIESGNLLDMAKATQAISIEGYATIQLTKLKEDAGRVMVTNRILPMATNDRVNAMGTMLEAVDGGLTGTAVLNEANLAQFVDAYGGEAGLRQFLAMYNRLPSGVQKNQFAKNGMFWKVGRSLVEIFQSALLSNPLTHGFNFAGQASFQQLLILERALGGEGAEAMAMFKAQFKYLPQAFRAGAFALRHEKSMTEASTKLESNMRAISRDAYGLKNTEEGGGAVENAFANFADGFGVMMRLQGYRPMLAMDDMFKAVNRGMQLEALAIRAEKDAYNSVIDTGKVPKGFEGTLEDYANQQSLNAHTKTINSQTAFEEASQFARMATFQDELEGFLGNPRFTAILNHPVMKIIIPFYKTPTKIVQRIMERTPIAMFMPSVIRDQIVNGSAFQRKQALAKVGLSSGMSATAMMLSSGLISDDIVITGYGETNPKARKTWLENHEPYSIGVKQDDGSWKWISYKRYDPISGVLGFFSDSAYTMRNSTDEEMNFDLFLNTVTASMKYVATSLPMTQFLGSLIDAGGSSYEDGESKYNRIVELIGKQVTTLGGTILQQIGTGGLAGQGMTATVERYVSPDASNVMPEERYQYIPSIGMPSFIKGHYEGLNQLRSRIPYLSKTLPTRTNRWNEPIPQNNGAVWEAFIPYRVRNKKAGNVINMELNRLGLGLNNLPRNMGEPMMELSGKQYQRYIELYNNPMASKFYKKFNDKNLPTALNSFTNLIQDKKLVDGEFENRDSDEESYTKMYMNDELIKSNRKHKITMIRRIDSKYKQIAKDFMFLEYPDLLAVKNQRESYENEYGENPPMINSPSQSELNTAKEQRDQVLENAIN